jgi:hypothetical protein
MDEMKEIRAPTMDEMKEMPTTQPPPRDYQFSYNINDEMSGSLNQRVEQQKNGVITGAYAYTAPDGKLMTVNYVADDKGFRPVMSEAQAPVMKTNTASTYTMSLPDSAEPIEESITQQEMEAMRKKVQENEQPLAYPQNQQNVPMKYTASAPAIKAPMETYPAHEQSAIQAPEQYSAPATVNVDPVQTYRAPSPVKTTVETPIQAEPRPVSYYR